MPLKEQLERLIDEMVTRGVRYEDAHREFEKKFISHILTKADGNLCQAADLLAVIAEFEQPRDVDRDGGAVGDLVRVLQNDLVGIGAADAVADHQIAVHGVAAVLGQQECAFVDRGGPGVGISARAG